MIIFYIVIAIVVILLIYIVATYNKLVNNKNKVENQFSQVDIQLKRRADLIPNLVETVKGYAKHEQNKLTDGIEAINKVVSANSINEKVDANNKLTQALNKLLMLSEAYPELKANESFLSLQKDLTDTEDKITYARQFYNDSAMKYNNIIEMFPSNIVASIFKFKKFEYFKIDENEKEVPKVKF